MTNGSVTHILMSIYKKFVRAMKSYFSALISATDLYPIANEYQSTLAISKRRLSAGVCLCLLSAQAESMVAKDSAGVGAKHNKKILKIRNIHNNATFNYINNAIGSSLAVPWL